MAVIVKEKKRLEEYNFSDGTKKRIEPIAELLRTAKLFEAKREIAKLALKVYEGIKNGALTPRQADDYFSLLDLYLDDNYPDLDLGEVVGDLLFEGISLHDLGESYSADLEIIRELAQEIIEG
jgi:hypothetical protein